MKTQTFTIEHNVKPAKRKRTSIYRETAEKMKNNDSVWFNTFGKALTLARYIMKMGRRYEISRDVNKQGKEGFRTFKRGRSEKKAEKKVANK